MSGPASSDDGDYDGLDPADFRVIVRDDDMVTLVFLPMVMRRWPPIPEKPTLDPIDNYLRDAGLNVVKDSAEGGSSPEHIRVDNRSVGRYHIQVFNFGGPGSIQPYHLRVAYGPASSKRLIQQPPPRMQ